MSSKHTEKSVTSDTYKTTTAERADKAALRTLADRMKVPDSWLKPDECGAWHISGPTGHIYAHANKNKWLGGYLVVCHPGDSYRWAAMKKSLGGTIRQDGDDEGVILVGKENVNAQNFRRAIGCAR